MSMATAMAYAARKQQREAIQREADRILDNLAKNEAYISRTVSKVAKLVLWKDTIMCNGYLRKIKVKSCGLGLYDVWTVQA
jgi:hypothetical protein